MKLDSFRELLIKKSDDPSLENLISFIKDDILADIVLESLEKMARSKHKGDSAGLPIKDFGVEMDPETEPNMIRDSLGHHASHYKAALKAGNQGLANEHAKQIFRTVDMADQAQKHSNGKLQVEAVSPHPWERQGKLSVTTPEHKSVQSGNKKDGEFASNTKGWNYGKTGNDFEFLQQAPHESYGNEVRKHGHNKAYPLEQIKVNGKYIDIKDVSPEELKVDKAHPFDKHPVMSHFEKPAGSRTPEDDQKWRDEHAAFGSSPEMDKYFDKQAAEEQANPEQYKNRGANPSEPVHRDVPGLDTSKPGVESATPATKQPSAQPGVIRRPAAGNKPELSEKEKNEQLIAALPPSMRDMWRKKLGIE